PVLGHDFPSLGSRDPSRQLSLSLDQFLGSRPANWPTAVPQRTAQYPPTGPFGATEAAVSSPISTKMQLLVRAHVASLVAVFVARSLHVRCTFVAHSLHIRCRGVPLFASNESGRQVVRPSTTRDAPAVEHRPHPRAKTSRIAR